MSAPVLWILLPSLLSIGLFIVRDKRYQTALFGLAALFFASITFFIRIDQTGDPVLFQFDMLSTYTVLGRSFVISQSDLMLVRIIFFANLGWSLFAFQYPDFSRVIPLGMLFSSLLLAAYAVAPFLYSSLVIELAVILSILLLFPRQQKDHQGILRYLIYQTLSMVFILTAGWFLAGGELTPVDPQQLLLAVMLLGLGFVFWLGIFPFHSWIPLIFGKAEPINVGFIFQQLGIILFLLILKFVDGFPWLRENELFFSASRLLGMIMMLLGSIAFSLQQHLTKSIGHLFLHIIGSQLFVIGIAPDVNFDLFSMLLASQSIGFFILTVSVQGLPGDKRDFNELPLADLFSVAGIIISLLSLSGMPLTLGFPPHQIIYQYVAGSNFFLLLLMLLSKILITYTAIRVMSQVYQRSLDPAKLIPANLRQWSLAVVVILFAAIGLFPKLVFTLFAALIQGFGNLIQ